MSAQLKRLEIKYIRDKAKSAYPDKNDKSCRICGSTEQLQYHHYIGLTNLWNKFKKKHKIKILSTEDILIYRDQFIATHSSELYDNGEFLCKKCHDRLHKVYGKSPSLGTAKKQARWVERQREKYNGNNTKSN